MPTWDCPRCGQEVPFEQIVWATTGRCELICPGYERKGIDADITKIIVRKELEKACKPAVKEMKSC